MKNDQIRLQIEREGSSSPENPPDSFSKSTANVQIISTHYIQYVASSRHASYLWYEADVHNMLCEWTGAGFRLLTILNQD